MLQMLAVEERLDDYGENSADWDDTVGAGQGGVHQRRRAKAQPLSLTLGGPWASSPAKNAMIPYAFRLILNICYDSLCFSINSTVSYIFTLFFFTIFNFCLYLL